MGGYELIFRPDEYGAATVEAFTLSLPGYISFKGEVGSSLGISRQYAYIPHPCLGEPEWSAKCEEDKALDAIYHGEPYGLRVNSKGRITPEHLYGPDPAPPTILLPNLSAKMFSALRHFIPDFRAPSDMFYFRGCAGTR
jgi:hypothetical protein